MFKNFLKTAVRNLWKNKTYSFLNIFGLSVGIACAGLIFLWVENEYSYDNSNQKKDRLYWIRENQEYNGKIYTFSATPGLMGPAMKTDLPGLANTARMSWNSPVLFGLGDKTIYERGAYADSSIFSMFNIPFVHGNLATVFAEPKSLAISAKMARKFFGDNQDILGKTLKLDNKKEFKISAVFQDIPENATMRFEWLAPFPLYLEANDWLHNWGSNGIITYVELKPGISPKTIDKQLVGYIQKREPKAVSVPFLFSMNDWRLRNEFTDGKQSGGRIDYVNMFSIIAWIVLLIACINFMNLATARSEKRAREVGVRKVLGAEKSSLIWQFISEAVFLSFLAVLLAIGIMALIMPGFNSLVEQKLSLGLDNPVHIVGLLLISIICGLVAGSYPALYLSSFNPIYVFKGLKMKSGSAALIRKGLVVFQFTIGIVLIICTIIIYQQVQHVRSRALGYNINNLLVMDAQENTINHFESLKQDLLSTGYVENAALSGLNMLWMGSNSDDYTWDGKDPAKKILITQDRVTPEYLSTTKTQLLEGRDFESLADSQKIIINKNLADMLGKGSAVGKYIREDTSRLQVIGVTANFVYGDMYGSSDPLIFYCTKQYVSNLYIRLKNEKDPEKALAAIEPVLKRNNPGYPFDYQFVDQQFNDMFKMEMLIGKVSRLFAALAVIISCLGLFGLAAYTAEKRTREIGIRKVLGASVSGLTTLLSKDFLQLVIISALIASPISWWSMHHWLQNYAYHIDISIWIFVFAAGLAVLIALFTISFQAIRAAMMNPVKSLRSE